MARAPTSRASLASLTSAQDEPHGWNAVVGAGLADSDVYPRTRRRRRLKRCRSSPTTSIGPAPETLTARERGRPPSRTDRSSPPDARHPCRPLGRPLSRSSMLYGCASKTRRCSTRRPSTPPASPSPPPPSPPPTRRRDRLRRASPPPPSPPPPPRDPLGPAPKPQQRRRRRRCVVCRRLAAPGAAALAARRLRRLRRRRRRARPPAIAAAVAAAAAEPPPAEPAVAAAVRAAERRRRATPRAADAAAAHPFVAVAEEPQRAPRRRRRRRRFACAVDAAVGAAVARPELSAARPDGRLVCRPRRPPTIPPARARPTPAADDDPAAVPAPPPFSITVRAFEHVLNVDAGTATRSSRTSTPPSARRIHGLQSDGERAAAAGSANVLPALREGAGVGDADGVSTEAPTRAPTLVAVTRVDRHRSDPDPARRRLRHARARDGGGEPAGLGRDVAPAHRRRAGVHPLAPMRDRRAALGAHAARVQLGGVRLAHAARGGARAHPPGRAIWTPAASIGERGRRGASPLRAPARRRSTRRAGPRRRRSRAAGTCRPAAAEGAPSSTSSTTRRCASSSRRRPTTTSASLCGRPPHRPRRRASRWREVDADDTVRVYAEAGTLYALIKQHAPRRRDRARRRRRAPTVVSSI